MTPERGRGAGAKGGGEGRGAGAGELYLHEVFIIKDLKLTAFTSYVNFLISFA